MFKTIQEASKYIAEHDIKMVDFKMVDMKGMWRHLTIPASRFNEELMTYGLGFDGSNYGYAAVEKSDMVFIPDLSSAALEPFAEIPTLTMIGDVCIIKSPQNIPFDQYPRNTARAAEAYMKSTGIADEVVLGPEFEMYVFDSVAFSTDPQFGEFSIGCDFAEWNSTVEPNHGYQIKHHGAYHITQPQDFSYDLRAQMCAMLEERGVPVKYHHTEVGGPGQIEIELMFGGLTEMADRTMMTKYICKNEAMRQGKTLTFMPKPICGEAGNGMHVHIILYKKGKPVFYDAKGYSQLSKTALYFIGGMLKHARSLCALTNPSTNSYKRLVPGFEAPVTIGYATANRSAVVRIPAYAKDPMAKRFELRNVDATCNPYYAYSAILMAGLDGVENKIDPEKNGWGPYDFNLFNLSDAEKAKIQSLPASMEEAMHALEEDHDYLLKGGVFSEAMLANWTKQRMAEAKLVNSYPNPMEFRLYYDL